MIYYPIETLVEAGVNDLMLVTGGNSAGDFLALLGNGAEFGLKHINYTYQQGHGGIAQALSLAEHFADSGRIVIILGDNILEKSIRPFVERFARQERGARIILKEVPDPERFGVPVIRDGRILAVEEKPEKPASPYAVIGVYFYDARVFDIIRTLTLSSRGELEISDVNNAYIAAGEMEYDILEGWWTDAGTFGSLLRANVLAARNRGVEG
jgi:glucose-1-phosphate thymidylyltransferase